MLSKDIAFTSLTRWSLFAHILRREKDIRAHSAMRAYFILSDNKVSQRTMKENLDNSVQQLSLTDQHPIRLHSSKDLADIKDLAQDRKLWMEINTIDLESCLIVIDEEL